MNAQAPLIETYLWLVVLSLWTITGGWDLAERIRKVVANAGT